MVLAPPVRREGTDEDALLFAMVEAPARRRVPPAAAAAAVAEVVDLEAAAAAVAV
jgi:hypothetical protein